MHAAIVPDDASAHIILRGKTLKILKSRKKSKAYRVSTAVQYVCDLRPDHEVLTNMC